MSEFEDIFGEEFFVIDSNNLNNIKSRLYGFIVSDNQIIQNEDIDLIKDISGLGSYIYIDNKEDISIYQDYNGCYGLYFYKNEEYFAISNSFVKLVDYLKNIVPLTFNEEFSKSFIGIGYGLGYKQTLVNEIGVIPRNQYILIDKKNKQVSFEKIDYQEHSVDIDSKEGIKILDDWFNKWIKIVRSIKSKTNNIQFSLSGGFDSRMVVSIMLSANIDLNKVNVYSINSKNHTHAEDYVIATEIANDLGFELNKDVFSKGKQFFKEIETPLKTSNYLKLGFHNQMNYRYFRYEEPVYYFSGGAGETTRSYFDRTPSELIEYFSERTKRVERSFIPALENNLKYTFNELKKEFNITDEESKELPDRLFSEIRSCLHFGKLSLEDYFSNRILLMPLLDPDLHKLKLTTNDCDDKSILMALIFLRYYPKLLEFRIQGDRTIDEGTMNYVKKLCDMYPYKPEEYEYISGPDLDLNEYENKKGVTPHDLRKYFKNIFYSRDFEHEFKKHLPLNLYNHIADTIETRTYFPLSDIYPSLATLKVINAVETSSQEDYDLMAWLNSFDLDKNEINPQIVELLLNYNTLRIDLINKGNDNSIEILENSDDSSVILIPEWFHYESGQGILISSTKNKLRLKIKCIKDGELSIKFRSIDYKSNNEKRIQINMDLRRIVVNNEVILSESKVVTYTKNYVFTQEVKDSEEIEIEVEWQPLSNLSNLP